MNMEKDVIITGYSNPTSEGVIIHLNKKTTLKTGNISNNEFWVSWDKIGEGLFNGYTEKTEVLERNKLRNPNTPGSGGDQPNSGTPGEGVTAEETKNKLYHFIDWDKYCKAAAEANNSETFDLGSAKLIFESDLGNLFEQYATLKTASLQKTIDQQAEEIRKLKQAADNMREAFAEIISLDNAQNRATFEDDFYEIVSISTKAIAAYDQLIGKGEVNAPKTQEREEMKPKEFPKLIIEHNTDVDETQYPYTAWLENCGGMVVQATSRENCIKQMLISIEVKMRHDAKIINS